MAANALTVAMVTPGAGICNKVVGELDQVTDVAIGRAVMIAKGRDAVGDGGGGIFHWGAPAAHDYGTVINPGGGTAVGWRRLYDGPMNALWFGMKADYVVGVSGTDNATPLARAMAACEVATQRTRSLVIPAGHYYTTAGVTWNTGVFQIIGEGGGDYVNGLPLTALCTDQDVSLFTVPAGYNLRQMRHLGLAWTGAVSSKPAVDLTDACYLQFDDLTVMGYNGANGFATGVNLGYSSTGSFSNRFRDCRFEQCIDAGIVGETSASDLFIEGAAFVSCRDGLRWTESNGLVVLGSNFESHTRYGAFLDGPQGVGDAQQNALFQGVRFESGGVPDAHVKLGTEGHTVDSVTFCGCFFDYEGVTNIDDTYGTNVTVIGCKGEPTRFSMNAGGFEEPAGPRIEQGTGAPSASRPNGSLYMRVDGTGGLYLRVNGAWVAVSTVA